jgi:hypothetical protein
MHGDPPKDEGLDRLLQEVHATLQENQRFLKSLQQDQAVEDELTAGSVDGVGEEGFEEL